MTGRQRLRAITRRIRKEQFTPEVRAHVAWAKALNRPERLQDTERGAR